MLESEKIKKICLDALLLANRIINSIGEKGLKEVHDEKVTDIATKGDRAVSDALIDFFKKQKIPAILLSEEFGRIEISKKPEYLISFDDIDGTDNYFRGKKMLPHCTVVAIFDSAKPKFRDALAAGVIEHNSKNIWLAVRGKGCFFNNEKIKTSGKKELNKRTLIIIDHYLSSNEVEKFLQINKEAWIKDFGSSALHLAGVGSGLFDGYVNSKQKGHELGAGFLLIKEAGGSISDFEGKPIDEKYYEFNKPNEIVAAASEELGKKLLEKII